MSGTPEQEARDMLERMDVEDAQSFTSGDVIELANAINTASRVPALVASLTTLRNAVQELIVAHDAVTNLLSAPDLTDAYVLATAGEYSAKFKQLRDLVSPADPNG